MRITIEKENEKAKVIIDFENEKGMAIKEYNNNLELYGDIMQMLPVLLE